MRRRAATYTNDPHHQRPRRPFALAGGTIKAYLVKKYKRPMEAGDAPEPTVGDRDVLVDIHAAGVNPLDAKIRDGGFSAVAEWPAAAITSASVGARRA